MPFEKGRAKTGGRVKGVTNLSTRILEALDAKGTSLDKIWVEFLDDPKTRFAAVCELTPYLMPKLSSVTLDAAVGEKMQQYEAMTIEEKIAMHEGEATALREKKEAMT